MRGNLLLKWFSAGRSNFFDLLGTLVFFFYDFSNKNCSFGLSHRSITSIVDIPCVGEENCRLSPEELVVPSLTFYSKI